MAVKLLVGLHISRGAGPRHAEQPKARHGLDREQFSYPVAHSVHRPGRLLARLPAWSACIVCDGVVFGFSDDCSPRMYCERDIIR